MSFTFILPLFPKLLEFYRDREAPASLSGASPTLLQTVLSYLNRYKAAFSRPIDSRYDIVLLGGALGSLFSCVFPRLHIWAITERDSLTHLLACCKPSPPP
jgi:hypothetical protein